MHDPVDATCVLCSMIVWAQADQAGHRHSKLWQYDHDSQATQATICQQK